MEDFIPDTYGSFAGYEPIRLSAIDLSKKMKKLINIDMIYVMEDVVGLTGTLFLFNIPLCSN